MTLPSPVTCRTSGAFETPAHRPIATNASITRRLSSRAHPRAEPRQVNKCPPLRAMWTHATTQVPTLRSRINRCGAPNSCASPHPQRQLKAVPGTLSAHTRTRSHPPPCHKQMHNDGHFSKGAPRHPECSAPGLRAQGSAAAVPRAPAQPGSAASARTVRPHLLATPRRANQTPAPRCARPSAVPGRCLSADARPGRPTLGAGRARGSARRCLPRCPLPAARARSAAPGRPRLQPEPDSRGGADTSASSAGRVGAGSRDLGE
jgi:hypothetical protein